MKLTKKGFTLAELLAVIVILGILALIVAPTIGNLIENAKKDVNKQSIYGILSAAETY